MWDEQFLESLVANVPGAIYRCAHASDWEMQFMSREIERITGYPAEDFIGNHARCYASVIHADDRDLVEEEVDACVARREPFVLEYRVIHRDGSSRWVHEQGRAVFAEGGEVAYLDGVIFDISERKRLEAELEQLAYNDPLTGLPNRAHFAEHVELALARCRRSGEELALLFLDLDDFKLVNDSFGHAVGDELLCEVARRLGEGTRATDIVARQGGDEFLVLMADLPAGTAEEAGVGLAGRLREALSAPLYLQEAEVYVSASIGISVGGLAGPDADELLKRADIAMYRAKHAGRDGWAVGGEETGEALARLSLAGRLRRAVDLDEFELHYQPLVELASGRMLGVEALIRWHHGERGLVMPGEFIPVAERDRRDPPDLRVGGGRGLPPVRGLAGGRARPLRVGQPAGALLASHRDELGAAHDRVVRHQPRAADDRDHRDGGDGEPGVRRGDDRRAAPARRAGGDRRLRHRALVAGAAGAARGDHAEDRSLVRLRRARRRERRPARGRDHRARAQPRPAAPGRGRGNRRAARLPAGARLQARPGLLLQTYLSPPAAALANVTTPPSSSISV